MLYICLSQRLDENKQLSLFNAIFLLIFKLFPNNKIILPWKLFFSYLQIEDNPQSNVKLSTSVFHKLCFYMLASYSFTLNAHVCPIHSLIQFDFIFHAAFMGAFPFYHAMFDVIQLAKLGFLFSLPIVHSMTSG